MLMMKPAGHRVLVKLETLNEKEEVSKGGIVIAKLNQAHKQARQRAVQKATVVAIGFQAFKAFGDGKPWCKVGDKVAICKHSGEDEIDEENGNIYRYINDEDIYGYEADDPMSDILSTSNTDHDKALSDLDSALNKEMTNG